MSPTRWIAAGVVLAWCCAGSLAAQGRGAQGEGLVDATSLDCTFTLMSTGTWTEGAPDAELDASELSFRFEAIDTQEATAEAIGPFGPSHIITRLTGDYLHFLQMFSTGPLYSTTIFNRETVDGKLMAVHTRHEYTDVSLIGFTSRPEQYYGDCAATRGPR